MAETPACISARHAACGVQTADGKCCHSCEDERRMILSHAAPWMLTTVDGVLREGRREIAALKDRRSRTAELARVAQAMCTGVRSETRTNNCNGRSRMETMTSHAA